MHPTTSSLSDRLQVHAQYSLNCMSFGIEPKRLKSLIDLYYPYNHGEELRYMIHLKGEDQLFRNLQTCPFQGISANSIEDRESIFGKNSLPPRKTSILGILAKAFSVTYICIPISLSIGLIFYNGLGGGGHILEGIMLLCATIVNWLLRAAQQIYLSFKWAKSDKNINDVSCTVVRENKHQKIFSSELTVGDVVEFRQGDTIPADGWLIEGFDISIVERHLSEQVEVQKDTLRKCITDIKAVLEKNPALNQKNIPLDQIKSPKSPVLLGGSSVKSGEGRMVVLCVGKYSRHGQFLALSRQRLEPNLLKQKMENLRSNLYGFLLLLSALYIAIYLGHNIQKAMMKGSLSHLLHGQQWQDLYNCLVALLFGAPLGLYLGLMSGFLKIKVRLWLAESILVDYAEDLPRMAAVTEICYDREKNWGKMQNREWWNEERIGLRREESEDEKEEVQMTEQSYIEEVDFSQPFRDMMRRGLKLKGSAQPGHHYFISQQTILKKNSINDWNVFQQATEQTNINYFCIGNTVRYLSLEDEEMKLVIIKGESRDILHQCDRMLMKSSGEVKVLTAELRTEIQEVIESMERRLVTTHAIAFANHDFPSLDAQIEVAVKGGLTFLCILGVTNSHDHSDYQIVRQLRQVGVSLVLVSSRPHAEAVNRSKFIGINTIEQDSLVLDSKDFAKVVGGVICFSCKKTFCQCIDDADHNPRLKNLEEFRRITKYLKVMSSSNFFQKYSLMIGYKNVGRLAAYMGTEEEDRPAQAAAYLSVAAEGGITGSQVRFPSNSLRALQSCIVWSRFAAEFARKLLQLMLPTSLVAVALLLLTGTLFQTVPLAPLQLLWVSLPLCIALALNLSWQRPQEILQEKASSFGPDSPLLPQPVRKQIISQCIIQILLLMVLLTVGHEFLPESADAFDIIIGTNWQAKYSNSNKDRVVSGLIENFMLPVPSYSASFDSYGVYSRHLTIVFNTFALMQMLNYFNCRKIRSRQINILEGLDWHNALFFLVTLAAHCLFIEGAPQLAQLYPYGLTIQQWLFSAGMAIIVWIVGFLVRLLPDSSHQRLSKQRWRNKSYNLNVKLIGKSDKFYEFDCDEDVMFKFH